MPATWWIRSTYPPTLKASSAWVAGRKDTEYGAPSRAAYVSTAATRTGRGGGAAVFCSRRHPARTPPRTRTMSATTAVERGSVTRSALLLAHRALEVRARHPERQQGLLVLLVGVGDGRLRLQRVLEEHELLGVAVHRDPQLLPLRLEGQARDVEERAGLLQLPVTAIDLADALRLDDGQPIR